MPQVQKDQDSCGCIDLTLHYYFIQVRHRGYLKIRRPLFHKILCVMYYFEFFVLFLYFSNIILLFIKLLKLLFYYFCLPQSILIFLSPPTFEFLES